MQPFDPSALHVTVARLAATAHVATLSGEIDAHTAPELRRRLQPLADGPRHSQLIVDLSGVTFLDSTGLGVLLAIALSLREHGGDLIVATPDPRLHRLFEVTGLEGKLQLERTLAEAVERVVARQYA